MNRLAGIIVAVIGVVITVLSITKVYEGLTLSGAALILVGGLVFGLSFLPKPAAEDVQRMSTGATLLNVFHSPIEVFRNLRRHPRWLVALLVMSVLSAVYYNAFMYRLTPERVTNHVHDKMRDMPLMNENARRQIEAGRAQAIEQNKNPVLRFGQGVNNFAGRVFLYAFLAAVFLLFVLVLGGSISYWQAFSAAVYAYFPVSVIWFVLNMTVLFLKDPLDIHPVRGQGSVIQDSLNFLASPAESPALYAFLSAFGLLNFLWLWLNATALQHVGERVTAGIAWIITLTVFLVGLVFSVVLAWAFPGFIS